MAAVKDGFKALAVLAAKTAADKKAEDLVLLDLRQTSDVADFLLIAGAGSSAQMRAVSDAVEDRLREKGMGLLRREGRPKDRWMALDYGGLVIHLLLPEAREFYRLEHLWEGARRVEWEKRPVRKRKAS